MDLRGRSSRAAGKDAVGRSAQRQAAQGQPGVPVAASAHQVPPRTHETVDTVRRRPSLTKLLFAGILTVAVLGGLLWLNAKDSATAIDSSKYQAVFLTNGQVYFGKLQPFTGKAMKLNDVYYLQAEATQTTDPENPQKTSSSKADVQLIKLGEELHGPEDEMIVMLDQLLFYENLKTDSSLAKSIQKHKETNN